ncbi:hypothetical protein GCM10017562_74500 [Streptomyces roseofulvus]
MRDRIGDEYEYGQQSFTGLCGARRLRIKAADRGRPRPTAPGAEALRTVPTGQPATVLEYEPAPAVPSPPRPAGRPRVCGATWIRPVPPPAGRSSVPRTRSAT